MAARPSAGRGLVWLGMGAAAWAVLAWLLAQGSGPAFTATGLVWLLGGVVVGATVHLALWWFAGPAGATWWPARRGADGVGVTLFVLAFAVLLGRNLVEGLDGEQAAWVGAGLVAGFELVGQLVPRLSQEPADADAAGRQAGPAA